MSGTPKQGLKEKLKQASPAESSFEVIVLEAWSDESTFTVFRDAQYTPNDGSCGLTL